MNQLEDSARNSFSLSCPRERVAALRVLMQERGIAMYIVPTADYHNSEYAGEHFAERRYLSGFTGSAGTLLVTMDEAGLWTDARYFLQAAAQLEGSGITLFKMQEEGVPTLAEYIKEHLGEDQVIGFDGRTVSDSFGHEMSEIAEKVHGALRVDEDLVDLIWPNRPALSCEPAWVLGMEYAGESVADKLARVRAKMKELGADVHLLSSLTDIAWLLNVRGNDIESVPVVVSYLALTADRCIWFVQEEALDDAVRAHLAENQIEIKPYEDFYTYIKEIKPQCGSKLQASVSEDDGQCAQELVNQVEADGSFEQDPLTQDKVGECVPNSNAKSEGESAGISNSVTSVCKDETESCVCSVLIDTKSLNYRACSSIPDGVKIIDKSNPSELMKATKNATEVANIRNAHVKDAVAVCKFMYWLKTNIGKIPMTEISASDYLADLRAQQEGFIELSFDTICGYADHGAIIHYSATPETDVELRPEGLLLVDSGGHYMEGTTDITRTFALGLITDEMRANFTRVCRSNINLANTRFLHGASGRNLDYVAREPMWEVGLDFKHGTGHGVGYVLSVHEGPNAFRWQNYATAPECVFEEGMVTTDEPGVYLDGRYGIRTESELLCHKTEKNEYGQFMEFENITYVPIDLDALDPAQMTPTERERLNAYHEKVYEVVAPYLEDAEREFLKLYTRPI